jgi:DNA uptake protein ComE-like DNA-binding protein
LDKRQERGLFLLVIILVVVILLNRYLPHYFASSKGKLHSAKVYVEQIQVKKYKDKKKEIPKLFKKENPNPILTFDFEFDPNTVTEEELLGARVPRFLVNNWMKFRIKGGKFYKKEDIKKLYGMTEEAYAQMEIWIEMDSIVLVKTPITPKIKMEPAREPEPMPAIMLGINSADSSQLLQLNGIGPFYAAAIVKYRDRLGGYCDINQLMELYKMDSVKLVPILKQVYLYSIELRQIPLNTIGFKELLKHPYMDYETTKFIMNKRNKLGRFAAIYQIKDEKMLSDSLYQKLLPYLKLDE